MIDSHSHALYKYTDISPSKVIPVLSFSSMHTRITCSYMVQEFTSEEDAIAVANDSEYGLAAAVFSADTERCARVTRRLRAGCVWENCCQPAFIQAPWGGYKRSGFGRELGRWGLEEFTGVKQITSTKSGHSWGLWG